MRGIVLTEIIWKLYTKIINDRLLGNVKFHDALHRCIPGRGTDTAVIETKLATLEGTTKSGWQPVKISATALLMLPSAMRLTNRLSTMWGPSKRKSFPLRLTTNAGRLISSRFLPREWYLRLHVPPQSCQTDTIHSYKHLGLCSIFGN
jgi:hypothetical protein